MSKDKTFQEKLAKLLTDLWDVADLTRFAIETRSKNPAQGFAEVDKMLVDTRQAILALIESDLIGQYSDYSGKFKSDVLNQQRAIVQRGNTGVRILVACEYKKPTLKLLSYDPEKHRGEQ